jgi:outer membrane protein W
MKVHLSEVIMKRVTLSVVLFLMVVGCSTISWAEGYLPLEGSIGFGARVYGVFPQSDSFLAQDLEFENGLGGEVFVSYRFLRCFALEGGVGYTEIDVKNDTLGVGWAKIDMLPIFAALQLRWISKKPEELKWIVPYASIGGGYYVLDIEEKSGLRNFWLRDGVGVDLEIDDTFFFQLGGGFDIFLTDHLVFNLDARYSWADMDIDERKSDGVNIRVLGDTVDFDAVFIAAGLKFYF